MPIFEEGMDILAETIGPNGKYATLEDAMRIREDKFVPNSEDMYIEGCDEEEVKRMCEVLNIPYTEQARRDV